MEIKYLIPLALLLTSSLYIITYDNTDYELQRNFRKPQNHSQKLSSSKSDVKDLVEKYKNYCLNGKDKSKLSLQEQHDEFVKGPCSPVIYLPGFSQVALYVEIDCEVLQKENPKIFDSCGWSTCNEWDILHKKPAKEYKLWIGGLFDPTLPITGESNHCFGDLIGLAYNKETQTLEQPKGLKVSWEGDTEGTKNKSGCGVNAIQDLSYNIIQNFSCALVGYKNFLEVLESMGYQSGLTFQAIPYDFRYNAQNSIVVKQTIKKALQHLTDMTGKKSLLIGFSYSTLLTVEALSRMDLQFKQDHIQQLLLVGPPIGGALKVLLGRLGGDSSSAKQIFGTYLGINYYNQIQISSFSSADEMFLKNTFEKFANEDWLKEIQKRIEYERSQNGQFSQNQIPFSNVFPNKDQICVKDPSSFKDRQGNVQCQTGIINFLEESFLNIENKEFFLNEKDVKDFITNYQIIDSERGYNIHQETLKSKGLQDLMNPQVPTALIFGSHVNTPKKFYYNKNTKKVHNETNEFYFPDKTEYTIGDGTVPAFAALIPAFKWSYEFQNNSVQGAKPIKLINYCSSYNQSFAIYDKQTAEGEKYYTDNSYQGLKCQCEEGAKSEQCEHPCIINDKYVVQVFAEALIGGQKSKLQKSFTQQELESIQQDCPVLKQ